MECQSSNKQHCFIYHKNTITPTPGILLFLTPDNPQFEGIVMSIKKSSRGFTNNFFDLVILNSKGKLTTVHQIVVERDHDPREYIS